MKQRYRPHSVSGVGQLSWFLIVLLFSLCLSDAEHADGGTADRLSHEKDGMVLSEAHMVFPRLDIRVGLTRLRDVRTKLGPSKMPRGIDGNDEVCYVSANPEDRTLVIFGTHDFVGRDLLAFVKIPGGKDRFSAACSVRTVRVDLERA